MCGEPCFLVKKRNKETAPVGHKTNDEQGALVAKKRQEDTRESLLELSRYYEREDRKVWTKQTLLWEGKHVCVQCIGDIPLTNSPSSGQTAGGTPDSPANQ